MTLTTFLHSLHPDFRREAAAAVHEPALDSQEQPQTDSSLPASVLCARVAAKWLRQNTIGVDVRHGHQLAAARTANVPSGRLVVHAHHLCAAELLAAAHLRPGHIVVGSPREVTLLATAALPDVQMLLLTVDDSSAGRDIQRRLNDVVVAQALAQPRLRLIGLHADISSGSAAFISAAAAVGQMIGTMADFRERHDMVMSRISVGIDTRTVSPPDLHHHAVSIDAAVRDACHTLDFPNPSVIVSAMAPDRGRRPA